MRSAYKVKAVLVGILLAAMSMFLSDAGCVLGQEGITRGCPDPGVIKSKEDGCYYIFSTGRGLPVHRSKDFLRWERAGRVFDESVPDWARKEVPGTRSVWAPDVSYFNGRYHLYYSISTFGSQRSCIGLATNTTLDASDADYKWIDHGKVVESAAGKTVFNAIDPAIFIDKDASVYLALGSFWDGIKMFHIDPKTGKPNPDDSRMYSLARRPQRHAIEAAYIIYRGEHYYLFVSFDACCDGVKSTYKVMVGRSDKVAGPYVDIRGRRMDEGGGSLVLASHGNWRGPGHNSVIKTEHGDFIVHHTYDLRENKGGRNLQIRPLLWTGHGWPIAGEPLDDSMPQKKTPSRADLLGTWEHVVDYSREYKVTILPDGKVNDPKGKARWVLDEDVLFLTWPDEDAPQGRWLDECYVAGDGKSYIGRNQNGQVIRGIKEQNPDVGAVR